MARKHSGGAVHLSAGTCRGLVGSQISVLPSRDSFAVA